MVDSWPMDRLDAFIGSTNEMQTTSDQLMGKATEAVKLELDFYITHYPDEAATDHLEAILDEIRHALKPFCKIQDENR